MPSFGLQVWATPVSPNKLLELTALQSNYAPALRAAAQHRVRRHAKHLPSPDRSVRNSNVRICAFKYDSRFLPISTGHQSTSYDC